MDLKVADFPNMKAHVRRQTWRSIQSRAYPTPSMKPGKAITTTELARMLGAGVKDGK